MSSSRAGRVIRSYRFAEGEAMAVGLTPADVAAGRAAQPEKSPEELLELARAEADNLLSAARREIEELCSAAEAEARAAGLEAGRAEALRQMEAEINFQVGRACQLVDSLIAERGRVLAGAQSEVLELALAIARKVVGDIATTQAGAILNMAQRALEVLGRPANYEVHVNPEDARRLEAYLVESGGQRAWALTADERVAPGGCVVTSGASQVDARLETQMGLIEQAFAEGSGVSVGCGQ